MTSLTEVYDGNEREVSSLRRLYAGTGLVLVGALLAILAVIVATTDLVGSYGTDQYGSIKTAGILAGLGVPAALVGVFTVLPAGDRVKAAAAIGSSLCLFGVALFWHAYPQHWLGHGDDLTLLVSAVYLLGLFIALWSLFTAVVNFKTRNDPGGMLEMNVTRLGRTKVVEVENSGGLGGVGFLGSTPDGDVETQTGESPPSSKSTGTGTGSIQSSSGRIGASAASDGGTSTADISSPMDADTGAAETAPTGDESRSGSGRDAEIVDAPESPTEPTDRYCGNCADFQYVRSSNGITPYCGRFDESMDDMDACEEWRPNRT